MKIIAILAEKRMGMCACTWVPVPCALSMMSVAKVEAVRSCMMRMLLHWAWRTAFCTASTVMLYSVSLRMSEMSGSVTTQASQFSNAKYRFGPE
ncbi:MAG: hypothetical protein NTZ50_04395 [Chloroflexi bacterium]|nr:hypothetical protein [Chloroflexota bacterium]